MTENERRLKGQINLAKKFGLVLASKSGQVSVFMTDDKVAQRLDWPGWKMHYPTEPVKLVPKRNV